MLRHNNVFQIWATVDYVVIMESYHGDSSYMYTTHEVMLRVYRYNTKWVYCLVTAVLHEPCRQVVSSVYS